MNLRTTFFLATAVIVGGSSLAMAEPMPRPPQAIDNALPPYEVVTIIRSTGFEPLGRPIRRGRLYELRALDQYSMDVVLFVDARTGRIVSVEDVGSFGSAYARGPEIAPPAWINRSYYREPPPPIPPRAIPSVPQRSAAMNARTPLPRTRPAESSPNAKVAAKPQEVTGSTPAASPGAATPGSKGAPVRETAPMPPVQPLE